MDTEDHTRARSLHSLENVRIGRVCHVKLTEMLGSSDLTQ